jgi:hypothetical protein
MSRVITKRGFFVKGGVYMEQENLTGYNESRAMLITCPVCFTKFKRAPSHVARRETCCCSRGCAAEIRKVRVISPCVSCGKQMELTPSNVPKKTTCSKSCSTLRRVKNSKTVKKTSFGAYLKRVKEISARQLCANCLTTVGPWAVKNLEASMNDEGDVTVNDDHAELWCLSCHMSNVAPLGAPIREANRKNRSK